MDLTMFLILLAALPASVALTGMDMHFAGGCMTYRFVDTTKSPYKLKITTLTSWVLGKGPCGRSCSSADIGKSSTRSRLVELTLNGATYFGNWTKEVGFVGKSNKLYEVITTEMINNIESHVTAVNVPMRLEQEIAEVIIDIDPTAEYTDVSVHGSYWRWFNYTYGVTSYPLDYRLQIKVNPASREDTQKPNNSPVAMFQPVYKILLNKATAIKLTIRDPDGDFIRCFYAEYVAAGGLGTLKNTVVNPDCSIVIDAQESAGFVDGGWGAIPITVMDYSTNSTLDKSTNAINSPFHSSLNVQFLIQTLKIDDSPEFVNPTERNEHEFIVYVGATLKIPLFAKPVSANEIKAFHPSSIPYRTFTTKTLKDDDERKGEKVKYTVVNWRPGKSDVGEYLVSALVTDTQGSDGLARNYIIIVKDIALTPQTDIPHSGPFFPLFPHGTGVVCMLDTTCSFPVYTNTNTPGGFISDVNYTTSTFQTTTIDPPEPTTKDGSAMFVSEVTVHPTKGGDQRICFEATENNGKSSSIKCLRVEVKIPDPCKSNNPCVNGLCRSHHQSYVCDCDLKHTGRHCESAIDFCASKPCLNNGICSLSDHTLYICDCSGTGHVGLNCETDVVDCKLGVCGPHGVCKDLNRKYECDCFSGYSGDRCETMDTKCQGVSCQNGGICIVEVGAGVCKCPLGFSGIDCQHGHVTSTVNSGTSGTKDDQFIVPSLPNGAELECFVNKACFITVYSQKGTPDVNVDFHSPDVNATVLYSKPDPITGAVKSLVIITPTKPGLQTLCVNSGSTKPDALCYKINTTILTNQHRDPKVLPRFKPPTPPDHSIINCIQGTPCHAVITTDVDIVTNNCTLFSGSTSAIVFKALKAGQLCETDVLFNPPATGDKEVCLQAGPMHMIRPGFAFQGERRCFTLKTTATDNCNPNPCSNGGACILQPGESPPYRCICPDTAAGDLCQYQKACMNSPCHNGGFCEAHGNSHECKCPVGYGGPDCDPVTQATDAQFTDPTLNNGATVLCEVRTTCDIPVFITGKSTLLVEGPKDEDVNVDLWKHIGKSGSNKNEDILMVTPLTVGIMNVCIQAKSSTSQMSQTICYHIKGNKGHTAVGTDDFKSPTLPAGTTIPCSATKQCHMMMYYWPNAHKCRQVEDHSSAGLNVHIFPSKLEGGSCVTDVLFSSDVPTGLRNLCLGLRSSIQRCFKVDPNTAEPCRNQNCGAGACIVEGDKHTCVCDDKHRGTACEFDIDVPVVG